MEGIMDKLEEVIGAQDELLMEIDMMLQMLTVDGENARIVRMLRVAIEYALGNTPVRELMQ